MLNFWLSGYLLNTVKCTESKYTRPCKFLCVFTVAVIPILSPDNFLETVHESVAKIRSSDS